MGEDLTPRPGRERFTRARQAREEAEKASLNADEASFVPPELKPLEKMMKETPLGLRPGISVIVIKTESDTARQFAEAVKQAGTAESSGISVQVLDILYKYIGQSDI